MKRQSTLGQTIGVVAILVLALGGPSLAAGSFDIIPAVGGHIHWHITHTTQTVDGADVTTNDVRIRRTGDLDATLERDNNTLPLNVLPDGSLQSNDALNNLELANFLAVLNAAHSITSASNAGGSNGWTAFVPIAQPASSQSIATPAPPLTVPIHATTSGATLAFNGEAQTTLTSSESGTSSDSSQSSEHRGGGRFGGFPGGGMGGGFNRGGGGNYNGGQHGMPITLKLKISGLAVQGVVTKLSIIETRAIEVDSRQYLNTETWTIVSAP